MGRLRSLLVAACAIAVVTGAGAVPAVAQAATGRSSDSPSDWSAVMAQALTAVQNFENAGPVTEVAPETAPVNSFVFTDNGIIPLYQSSVLTSDDNGNVLVGVSDLDQEQLVVNAVDPDTGDGATLVLQPQSDTVSSSHRIRSAHRGVSPFDSATAGGCYAQPTAPIVVGSMFGPLVEGTGIINCPFAPENLALIGTIYRWGTPVGGGRGNTWGTSLVINVFDGCSPGATNAFATAQLWAVNGALQPGAKSGVSWLGCS